MVASNSETNNNEPKILQSGQIVDGKWRIKELLGKGACGVVYKVEDRNRKGWFAAMKIEYTSPDYDQTLRLEIGVLLKLKNCQDMLKLVDYGKRKSFTYMVTTICGKDLMALRCKIKRGFNDSSVLRIAVFTLYGLKQIHEAGYIHRDVKPGNVITAAARGRESRLMILIDFGMARSFVTTDSNGKKHLRMMRRRIPLRGTVRYCSMNVHERIEQGRGDDLTAMMYMLVEVTLGLPWHNLKNEAEVMAMKKTTKDSELFEDLPDEFRLIFEYVKVLKYEDRPSYSKIYSYLMTAIKRMQINFLDPYEWEDEEIEKDLKAEKIKEEKEKADKADKADKEKLKANENVANPESVKRNKTDKEAADKDKEIPKELKIAEPMLKNDLAANKKEKEKERGIEFGKTSSGELSNDPAKSCHSLTMTADTVPPPPAPLPPPSVPSQSPPLPKEAVKENASSNDVNTAIDYDASEIKTFKPLPREELQFLVYPIAAPSNFGETTIPF